MQTGIYPPRRSGEGSPIGAFGNFERSEGLYSPIVGDNHGRKVRWGYSNVAEDGNDTTRMALTAIVINTARELRVGVVLILACLMLMVVMTEVLSLTIGLMLAISRHRRPTQLERQQDQQEDNKQAAHEK
jgi:hypothetical protein